LMRAAESDLRPGLAPHAGTDRQSVERVPY